MWFRSGLPSDHASCFIWTKLEGGGSFTCVFFGEEGRFVTLLLKVLFKSFFNDYIDGLTCINGKMPEGFHEV